MRLFTDRSCRSSVSCVQVAVSHMAPCHQISRGPMSAMPLAALLPIQWRWYSLPPSMPGAVCEGFPVIQQHWQGATPVFALHNPQRYESCNLYIVWIRSSCTVMSILIPREGQGDFLNNTTESQPQSGHRSRSEWRKTSEPSLSQYIGDKTLSIGTGRPRLEELQKEPVLREQFSDNGPLED